MLCCIVLYVLCWIILLCTHDNYGSRLRALRLARCRLRIGFAKNAEPLGVAFEVKDTFGEELASELSGFRLNLIQTFASVAVSFSKPMSRLWTVCGCHSLTHPGQPDGSEEGSFFAGRALLCMPLTAIRTPAACAVDSCSSLLAIPHALRKP